LKVAVCEERRDSETDVATFEALPRRSRLGRHGELVHALTTSAADEVDAAEWTIRVSKATLTIGRVKPSP
jgi:hypothetical protein